MAGIDDCSRFHSVPLGTQQIATNIAYLKARKTNESNTQFQPMNWLATLIRDLKASQTPKPFNPPNLPTLPTFQPSNPSNL